MSQYFASSGAPPRGTLGGRITWAVQRLILLTSALFVLQTVLFPLDALARGAYGHSLIEWAAFRPGAFLSGSLWQPFTYMFLHSGLWHLFMNMLGLFFFGPEVEREVGTPQFYRMYAFCGAAGVLATLFPFIVYGADATIMGASGATMGVLVAFVVLDPQREIRLFPIPFPITALWMLLFFLGLNIIASLQGSAVSVATHLGGMAAGFAYMKVVPQVNRYLRRRKLRIVPKPEASSGPSAPPEWDKIGKVVDDILKGKDRDFPGSGRP